MLNSARRPVTQLPLAARSFSSTPIPCAKKAAKQAKADKKIQKDYETAQKDIEPSATDPADFTKMNEGITKALEQLQYNLQKLRTGGRFNPELLEGTRVQLEKDSKVTHKIGELAQVIPKGGRQLMLLVGEKDHVRPIISAIQNSKDLNLQPVQDPHNASQLNIPIPPPTKESRDAALAAAHDAGVNANNKIATERAAMQKKLRQMELKKLALPDDLKKAHKTMEALVKKGQDDVKKTIEVAKKAMEQA
jgi:ribosome recycling factor